MASASLSKINSNKHLRHVLSPDISRGEQNQIDLDVHLANGGILCVCTAKPKLRELSRLLNYLFCMKLHGVINRCNDNTKFHIVSVGTT